MGRSRGAQMPCHRYLKMVAAVGRFGIFGDCGDLWLWQTLPS